ncbi:MAG: 50S ribosomal protein L23 [SAR202 cluster bacterium]|nr:50S ribosomal protein L23 [SAR202 cluster bacterium]
MQSFEILKRPIITEKSTLLQEQGRYAFEVASHATKLDIESAVEKAFNVKVVKVNTVTMRGKAKRFGPKIRYAKSWKKAIVTLKQGDKITLFEGV